MCSAGRGHYLAVEVVTGPLSVREEPHALAYGVGLENAVLWTTLYIVAVIGPALLSGYPSIIVFGVANLLGITVVALAYRDAFASLWCVYAALTSVLVMVHMLLRRRMPEHHRLETDAPTPVG